MMPLREKLISGSVDALEEVYRLFFDRVFKISMRYLRNRDAAADITQDVFVKLWRNRDKISCEVPIDQQLFVITKRLIIDHFRKVAAEEKLLALLLDLPDHRDQSQSAVDNEESDEFAIKEKKLKQIYHTVDLLPKKQKEVFKMLKIEGLTYEEIADVLKISPNTVSNHFSAAVKFIRQRLLSLLYCYC